ncbi:hypothetical protein D3C76_1633730 [compost metagenome]
MERNFAILSRVALIMRLSKSTRNSGLGEHLYLIIFEKKISDVSIAHVFNKSFVKVGKLSFFGSLHKCGNCSAGMLAKS